ncbi:hemerythrin domain-containing protein [uncultured Clostridium sp.]|uniref:hemerythrin domain-containing protein n=1 Tax=uncultured Clostridium sp. TaxID=59620 RepID=UPI0028F11C0C|nr:hemerythrin domain-containing protein [uncultured Clostridium sp.]
MNAIELMVEEHKNIKRMLKVIRRYCYKVLKDENVDYNDFYRIIDFVRNYADKHHHSKEENILFTLMDEEFEMGKKGPITGMLIEHDLGRLYMHNLELALKELENGNEEAKLDVIANAISYTDLLNRHIDKEDSIIYTFAERSLSEKSKDILNTRSREVEEKANQTGVQNKYISLIEELEKKVEVSQ